VSVHVPECTTCGRTVFPPRALCPVCGGAAWRERHAAAGVVAEVTEVGGVGIVEVRTDQGPVVVARAAGPLKRGDRARLESDAGVPVATPHPGPAASPDGGL
jgi:hypothetical protein